MQTDGVQHSQGDKVNTRLKLRGQICPNGVKGHTEASRDAIIAKKMLYGSKIRDSGLDRKLKFSDKFCQIFPGRTISSIFCKIQRSRPDQPLAYSSFRNFSLVKGNGYGQYVSF